jgi:hypothetical protein
MVAGAVEVTMRFAPGIIPAILAGAVGATGCFYTHGNVNLRAFENPTVRLERAEKSDSVQNLGRVRGSARGWLFEGCDTVAYRAVTRLLEAARGRGANRVSSFRFRGHWTWISEPVCRRNVNYVWLIVPAFLPVPTSATVSGVAIHDAALEAVSAKE